MYLSRFCPAHTFNVTPFTIGFPNYLRTTTHVFATCGRRDGKDAKTSSYHGTIDNCKKLDGRIYERCLLCSWKRAAPRPVFDKVCRYFLFVLHEICEFRGRKHIGCRARYVRIADVRDDLTADVECYNNSAGRKQARDKLRTATATSGYAVQNVRLDAAAV